MLPALPSQPRRVMFGLKYSQTMQKPPALCIGKYRKAYDSDHDTLRLTSSRSGHSTTLEPARVPSPLRRASDLNSTETRPDGRRSLAISLPSASVKMPHTSRKKRSAPNKRQEVVDDDGWTRITSSHSSNTAARLVVADTADPGASGMTFKWHVGDRSVVKGREKEALQPMQPTPGTSLESMQAQYRRIEAKWLETALCGRLVEVLNERILNAEEENISLCVMFGSGSLCGDALHWVDRHESTYYQVAAFKSVVDAIARVQGGRRPRCLAQEPYYNTLDVAFLETLGVTVVNHPEGFDVLDGGRGSAFVYSPAAEQEVECQTMFYRPRIWLHRPLDHLLGTLGGSRGGEFSRDEAEINADMTEAFQNSHECAALPEVNLKNFPFHGSTIWWRRPAAD